MQKEAENVDPDGWINPKNSKATIRPLQKNVVVIPFFIKPYSIETPESAQLGPGTTVWKVISISDTYSEDDKAKLGFGVGDLVTISASVPGIKLPHREEYIVNAGMVAGVVEDLEECFLVSPNDGERRRNQRIHT